MKEDRSNFRNASGNKGNLQYTQNSDVKNFGLYTLVNLDMRMSTF
jgi:hypothetical protein